MSAQLDLSFGRQHTAMAFIASKPELFRPDFGEWLMANWDLFKAFEREANLVAVRGRRHYSANTIIEYLRHETALREINPEFKFNDRWTSSIARLYPLMNPGRSELFEYRTRHDGVVKSAEMGVMR